MSAYVKTELAATCTTLGRLHKGEYLIEPECIESVKDLIRYLKRDTDTHDIRRYLGESKVLQNDLVHIIKSCPEENADLFDVTLRLLINLTTPALLFFGEEVPTEKTARNIYLSLTGHEQEYKTAFCDVQFWNKVCGKLTGLFETDWTERSADDGIQIERILMLLRNVLQVPADEEGEKRPENDITVHDKVLWALRQSQILELLLFVSSNTNEEQYYLNLLEIFSLILREQNPKTLARCDIQRSAEEKNKDAEDLLRVRESERKTRNKYLNMRNFTATFVVKGMKSLSDNDLVCHKSLNKVTELDVVNTDNRKVLRARRHRVPVESERAERRSTFSVRLFLKEFCVEFLTGAFSHLMNVVKNKLDSGKSLPNDQTYYFWAVRFFLEFAMASDSSVDLIRDLLSTASFHYVHTSMENALEHLTAEKKKTVEWIRRIHLILKAYHSLLQTLLWMDLSKSPLTRSMSREIKSQIFYVAEYREMTLHLLLKYDPAKFPLSYLRDLVETTHLFVKLLEEYSRETKMVVQSVRKKKKPPKKRKKKKESQTLTGPEAWEKIKDEVYDSLCGGGVFPEIPPFDAALDIPIDDQKGRAMKRIQVLLRKGKIGEGIGLLRSARQVWPENDYFGAEGMSVEEETMALQEICMAELGEVEGVREEESEVEAEPIEEEEEEREGFEDEIRTEVVEQDFDIMEYKKRLVNKRVVEGCGILLKNYKKNSDQTNHCAVKLLHRIGWECCMPAVLFQASLFWTLLTIMRDSNRCYEEINTFTVNLVRKFRKHAAGNPVVFLELLFWKEHNVALEIQHGYQEYEEKAKGKGDSQGKKKRRGKKRGKGEMVLENEEVEGEKEEEEEEAEEEKEETEEEQEKEGEEEKWNEIFEEMSKAEGGQKKKRKILKEKMIIEKEREIEEEEEEENRNQMLEKLSEVEDGQKKKRKILKRMMILEREGEAEEEVVGTEGEKEAEVEKRKQTFEEMSKTETGPRKKRKRLKEKMTLEKETEIEYEEEEAENRNTKRRKGTIALDDDDEEEEDVEGEKEENGYEVNEENSKAEDSPQKKRRRKRKMIFDEETDEENEKNEEVGDEEAEEISFQVYEEESKTEDSAQKKRRKAKMIFDDDDEEEEEEGIKGVRGEEKEETEEGIEQSDEKTDEEKEEEEDVVVRRQRKRKAAPLDEDDDD